MLKRLHTTWASLNFPLWTAPLALLLAVALSYGLRLPSLGLYWDDWPYLWFYQLFGAQGMYATLGSDRPLLGVLYAATLGLLGSSPLAWQVFALLMRWLCALAFWAALRQAWPQQPLHTFGAALLFAVYPAFTQHWISVVWGNAYVLYAGLFFSLALTAWAARSPARRWPAQLLAFALSAFTLFSTEYFFGLELLRPLLAWFALAGVAPSAGARLRRALLGWLPFLALLAGFAAWRSLFHPFGGGGGAGLLNYFFDHPLELLTWLPGRVLQDLLLAVLGGWGKAFQYGALIEGGGLEYALLALLGGLACWLYLARARGFSPAARWPLEAAFLGLFAFLAAGLPLWLTRLPYTSGFPWDRFALVYAPGVCLLTAALLSWLGKDAPRWAFLAALLFGLSAGTNNLGAAVFRADWNAAAGLLWQFAWRAPAIQPGTALLTDRLGLRYFEDDTLSAMLAWTYAPPAQKQRMEQMIINIPERLESMGYLVPNSRIAKDFRVLRFEGSTSQAVVWLYNPPGCLQILDPARDGLRPDLPEFARRALTLSRPQLLLAQPPAGRAPAAPPQAIFGGEPKRKWCYYYEQAELARQSGAWEQIARLKAQSIGAGYFPQDPYEYLPFVEADMRRSAWDDARQLSKRAYDLTAQSSPTYCALWQRAAAWAAQSDSYRSALRALREELQCTE